MRRVAASAFAASCTPTRACTTQRSPDQGVRVSEPEAACPRLAGADARLPLVADPRRPGEGGAPGGRAVKGPPADGRAGEDLRVVDSGVRPPGPRARLSRPRRVLDGGGRRRRGRGSPRVVRAAAPATEQDSADRTAEQVGSSGFLPLPGRPASARAAAPASAVPA